ncbi:hypothetical protein Tco_0425314, partial [Tanacetum coccineum]
MNLVTKLSDRIGVLEADLKKTKTTYSSAYTKLILRVKKLESQIKIGKARRQARVQDKGSNETEPVIQDVTPTEVIQDQESSEKGSAEVSTAGAKKGTASEEVLIVSTAGVNLSTARGTVTYTRRSAEKRSRQDKGKAIMIEPEPKKKSKKELIAKDEEIARQWDEEERKRAMSEAKTSKKIDWNDPSVISDFKGMSYNDIRPILEKVWDFNQNIEPIDVEHGSEKKKSPEKIVEEDVDTQEEMKEVVKEPRAKRKKSIPRKSTRKIQKLEENAE